MASPTWPRSPDGLHLIAVDRGGDALFVLEARGGSVAVGKRLAVAADPRFGPRRPGREVVRRGVDPVPATLGREPGGWRGESCPRPDDQPAILAAEPGLGPPGFLAGGRGCLRGADRGGRPGPGRGRPGPDPQRPQHSRARPLARRPDDRRRPPDTESAGPVELRGHPLGGTPQESPPIDPGRRPALDRARCRPGQGRPGRGVGPDRRRRRRPRRGRLRRSRGGSPSSSAGWTRSPSARTTPVRSAGPGSAASPRPWSRARTARGLMWPTSSTTRSRSSTWRAARRSRRLRSAPGPSPARSPVASGCSRTPGSRTTGG